MEPVTHILFGGVMARAGLNRKSALATITLVLAAEAPDLDIVTAVRGHLNYLQHHRGITHTFVGIPLVSALVVLVLYLWYQWFGRHRWPEERPAPRWGVLFGLACLAGLGHILLDFTNNYGLRPFEPFSQRWYSWDIVFIAEPVLWTILLGGLLVPALFKASSGSRGRRRQALAVIALVLTCFFWELRDYQHRRAVAVLQAQRYQGEPPLRVSAYPYAINPFRWYCVAETSSFYDQLIVSSRRQEIISGGAALLRHKPAPSPEIRAARNSSAGQFYFNWAQYPVIETRKLEQPQPGYLVRFSDLRFLYPDSSRRPTLSVWVQLDPHRQVVAEGFGNRK